MKCEDCKFAQSFVDPFTRKHRICCGKGLKMDIGDFGDTMLVTSEYVADCKHGEPKGEEE